MEIEFDERKNARNIEMRGLSFDLVVEFEWNTVAIRQDKRYEYGEPRYQLTGYIRGRICVAVMTPRGSRMRVISLRHANVKERKKYEKETFDLDEGEEDILAQPRIH